MRWAEPEVEVDFGGWRGVGLEADASARLVAERAGDEELAVVLGLDQLGEVGPLDARPALRAVLNDALVFTRCLDGDPSLVDVMAARLLDVDVLAGLGAPDGHQGVPVVGSGDGDDVDLGVVEHGSDIGGGLRGCAGGALFLELSQTGREGS